MREFKVRLTPATAFEVATEDGNPLGRFTPDGPAWNGMQCLVRDDGATLIIVAEKGIVGGLAAMFGDQPRLATVMSASPILVPLDAKEPPPQLSGEEADRIRELMIKFPATPGRDYAMEEFDARLMKKLNAVIAWPEAPTVP